ncbi:MAG: 16S rRNA (cytidine(1402)-2'-O)-methyltransferase [Betaproteobacteria bacterium]
MATALPDAGEARFRAEGGSLYVVATPLGNLRDVTLRALDILGSADIVAAEDTRVSGTLLRCYGIATRMISLHAHNEAKRAASLIEHLREGRSVALVTDAGTPGISDPGARLVAAVRDANLPVVPIPGPSAAIAAISAAGLVAEHFFFVGFLPAQPKARRALLAAVGPLPCALVLYEAPHRIGATLAELAGTLEPDRRITIARELSKRFETIAAMPLRDAPEWIGADANRERGEFVLIVDVAAKPVAPAALDATGVRWLRALLEQLPPAQAARIAAAATGVARGVIYAQALAMKPDPKDA